MVPQISINDFSILWMFVLRKTIVLDEEKVSRGNFHNGDHKPSTSLQI